ncbi:MAG: 2Fe-2S iron-sulfur cluster-binding protein [Polyangiaceae bacterium]
MKAKITFRDPQIDAEVPVGITLLEAAELAGAPVGTHCGGVGACTSCHVRIEQGAERLSETSELEEDGLDRVFDARQSSRLACQAKIERPGELVVRITEESVEAWLREHPNQRK